MGWLRNYGGRFLLGILAVGLLIAIVFGFRELMALSTSDMKDTSLPLLAIGGVVMLILLLTVVAIIFWFLDLTEKGQAMGLPEGSIRAVIALSLIVLFAILAVFLKAFRGQGAGQQS